MNDLWPGRALAPSLDDIAGLAEAAFEALPELFRKDAGEIVFRVDDFPDDEMLDALGLKDPFERAGLYQGVDLSRRSILDAAEPARVFLFRRPLLDEWVERGDVALADLVAHILIHEIGHHLGLSDEQIHSIETS